MYAHGMLNSYRLVTGEGDSMAAAAKAVGDQNLRKWHARLALLPSPCGEGVSVDELRAENDRLRRGLRRAEMERDLLKKATAYFARESLC